MKALHGWQGYRCGRCASEPVNRAISHAGSGLRVALTLVLAAAVAPALWHGADSHVLAPACGPHGVAQIDCNSGEAAPLRVQLRTAVSSHTPPVEAPAFVTPCWLANSLPA